MAKTRYAVKTRLEHDHELYLPGATIELDDKAAAPLIDVRAIEPAPAESTGEDKGKKK